ncbi:MAG: mechanosensitive ion channel family protein, partial [Planctomycetota bacterium]
VIARLARERIAAGEGAGETLPEAASPDALDQRIQAARAALADITARMLQVTSDLASVATRVEATTRSLEESKQDKIARAAAVERETAWATFVREVQSVETPKLIDTFKETVGKIETAMQQLRELADASNLAGGVVDAAAKALAADPDPVVLNVLNETAKRDEFNAWLRGNQLSDAGIDVVTPAEGSVTSTNGSGAGLTDGTPAGVVDSGPTAQTGMRINMMLELRDQTVARRLGYFRDRHKQFDALAGAIRDRIARLGEEHKAALAAVELARRAWAGATTLEIRAARGDSATLPAQVKAWTQRDQVNALQARADAIRQQIDRSTGRLDAIAAGNSTDGFIEPLDARFKNLSSIIEKLRERQDLERNFETPDPATLSELDAKKLAHEVDQRMSADTGTWEKLVGFFGGAAVQDLDGLLAEYYQRVLDLERKTDNLTQRSNFTTAIEQLTEASRPIQEAVAKRVAERLAAAEAALTRELLKVKLILQPGNKDTQEKAAALGIDPAQLQKLPDSDDAGLKAAKDKLVASLLRPWARVAGYRRWQEQIAAALAQLGAIDAEIGRLKDVIASINAAAADHLRRIERLVGHTPAQLAALPVADRPAAVEMDRYRLGEIGMLRRERVQKLNWAAGGNALWLLLIPFIAWIAIRAASLVGNRLVARVTVEPADGAPPTDRTSRREREERAQTLFHVFRAAWTIIVFVLAAIYMLKAISVDVTPLIASAGIFGLAIAFGAQPLVRDFFAGFFILLENQYNLHDVVTINGITGTIERITLRLTIIRDIEGKVHYIPNGQIELVTNQTKSWARARLEIGTAYSNHPDEVIACLQEVCAGLKADHAHGRELLEFEVPGIESFGDNSINYRVHIKVIAGAQWKIAREFRRRVKLEFDKRGIEIPFPQRVIHQAAPPSALPGPSSMT